MRLDIFQNFKLQTMIFSYDSFQFRRMFRGAGSFSLTLNDLSDREYLKEDTVIVARNDAWIIENIHGYKNINGEITMELTGRHINSILDRRVVPLFTVNTTESIEAQLYQLITDNFISPDMPERTIAEFELAELKGIEQMATTEYSLENVTVLEILNKVCGYSSLGYRLNYLPEEQKYVFEILEGRYLANDVFFSEEYGNVSEAEVYRESENYKNAGLKEGVWSGTASGLDRREVILNADETLADHSQLISVDGMVLDTEQFVYLEDWDLGDTVSYLDKTLGFFVENPVLEIQETYAKDVDLEVTFGERMPTIF